jgi:hypothetical protein
MDFITASMVELRIRSDVDEEGHPCAARLLDRVGHREDHLDLYALAADLLAYQAFEQARELRVWLDVEPVLLAGTERNQVAARVGEYVDADLISPRHLLARLADPRASHQTDQRLEAVQRVLSRQRARRRDVYRQPIQRRRGHWRQGNLLLVERLRNRALVDQELEATRQKRALGRRRRGLRFLATLGVCRHAAHPRRRWALI